MELPRRFWEKVKKSNGCWEWVGAKGHNGYGRFKIRKKLYLPHRLSYESSFGKIPKGQYVCHKCDNPCCLNPKHLFVGSQSDNMRDAFRKGRASRPIGFQVCGEDVKAAKLTNDAVLRIKNLRQFGVSVKDLCTEYSVNKTTIYRVLNGQSWAHVTG